MEDFLIFDMITIGGKNMKKLYRKIRSFFSDESRKMKQNDWIIVGILVLIYAVLSFSNLGTLENPQTFLHFDRENMEATLELQNGETEISKIRHYAGDEVGSYKILASKDGETYEEITTMKDTYSFAWSDTEINSSMKYIKVVSETAGGYIGEIQLYDQYGDKVSLVAASERSKLIVDEPEMVPGIISYLNSTYFDEIYFARSAYEYANDIQVIEWVHPPLGKLLQMIPILFLGMNTFAYRLMGNIAGILMIPVIYSFAKTIFKNRKYAFLAAMLMTFDTFHFAQTRMGTADSFLVLFMMLSAMFMYKYLLLDKYDSIKPKLKYLGLSGLFFGLATCVKWTGLYLGLGLAIVFFGKMLKDIRKDKKISKQYIKIILSCLIFFVAIPVIIYVLNYFLFPNVYPDKVDSFSKIIDQIKGMFSYHSGLTDDHPFSSPWYTWPLMLKPVWFYVSYPGLGIKSTIVGIGNPAIWWVGIIGALYTLIASIKKRKLETVFLLIIMLSLWLPYAFIGRVMFLYHYFPVIPFLMLAIVALLKWITEKFKTIWVSVIYISIVVILFGWFYPVVSGTVMPETYIDSLKWLATWIF